MPDAKERTRKGLKQGLEWIERVLEVNRIRYMEFVGDNPELIHFAKKRLGFRGEAKRLYKPIGAACLPA